MAQFDRTEEDLGNIVMLEHVNTRVSDQQLAWVGDLFKHFLP